ncbi:MAG TPA: DEAD/DEAH box helicase, partial [Terrimicrobiaceae bacterium]
MNSSLLQPETPLTEWEEIPRSRLAPLARLGLSTVGDLIRHYPRRYEDRRRFDRFPDAEMDRPVCLFGVVTKTALKRIGGWRRMFEITLEDESAGILGQPLTCRWFNMPYMHKLIVIGQHLVVFGRPKEKGSKIVIDHPEFEAVEEEETSIHMNRITPVYPAGDGASPRVLRTLIYQALEQTDLSAVPRLSAACSPEVLRTIHFPETFEELDTARRKLVREEFFAIQLLLQARRADWRRLSGTAKIAKGKLFARLLETLPFSLTASQSEVIEEIRHDLSVAARMNRLLQGDVGSGKTLVALAAVLHAVESGWQAALMAPTQILAEQHYLNFKKLLEPLGIPIALRTAGRNTDTAPLPLFANQEDRGAHASPRAPSGVPPENLVQRDAPAAAGREAYAPQEIRFSRRNLPHFERPWAKYIVTFTSRERASLTPEERDIVLNAILHERIRFELYAACVMPDHVHLLIEPSIKEQDSDGAAVFFSLTEILHALKSFTAHQINKLRGKRGQVWEKESFDRLIRSEADLQEKFRYITRNPWDAGIVGPDEDYAWLWFPGGSMDRGAHASPHALSGVSPENPVRRDAEQHTRDACAPRIIIGTHALLYESSEFNDLGLIVIDEQHKFGVLQRTRLIARGDAPDVLVMTATPIPRTLTQTLYGDLDVSILREKPAHRGEVITAVRNTSKLPEVIDFVKKQIARGRQAYIVYPLVEDSEKLAAKSATVEFEKWKSQLAPYAVGLLHGRMSPAEKEEVVSQFRAGGVAALVTTTVIEVGIDVPNATLMVVENAERFGLAQLHQL